MFKVGQIFVAKETGAYKLKVEREVDGNETDMYFTIIETDTSIRWAEGSIVRFSKEWVLETFEPEKPTWEV